MNDNPLRSDKYYKNYTLSSAELMYLNNLVTFGKSQNEGNVEYQMKNNTEYNKNFEKNILIDSKYTVFI
jgi:hypothetical protein